ncbi:hypothetical protein HA402_006097 [Bradysia odoriphaga]|nr:hypothetical protein HA402_006097 [Bradysia odoriphaga]
MENKGDPSSSETKQNDLPNGQIDDLCVEPGRKRTNSDSQHSSEEPAKKKQRLNASTVPVFQPNIHVTEQVKSFADLPIEMLDEIFNNLTTFDLLNCRRINRQWNEASSRIMRGRDDITLHFAFTEGTFVQKIHHQHCEKLCESMSRLSSNTLLDLVNSMQNPEKFPFTSYRFDGLSNLEDRDMNNFLTIFGKKIRSLKVNLTHSKQSGEILRKLVFEEAPNLKILEIFDKAQRNFDINDDGDEFWRSLYVHPQHPTCNRLSGESINLLQLPQLEILCVDRFREEHTKIIEAILIASPLKSISIRGRITEEDLELLKETNKLHCVRDGYLMGKDIIEYWLKCGPIQLQSLNLRFFVWGNHQPSLGDIETLNQLLQSIKDNLLSFTTEQFGSLSGFRMPKFEKLQRLCLRPDVGVQSWASPTFLPPFDWTDTFPNIKELEISLVDPWLDHTFRQSLKTLPTIETLRIQGGCSAVIAQLIKFTPNVKTLMIMDDGLVWYGQRMGDMVNFKDISTFLPKLENFGWEMVTGTKDVSRIPHMHEFDAKITGLPADLCIKLAEKLRDQNHLSADEVAKYHSQEREPSILDLKGLKHFYAVFTVIDELNVDSDGYCYSELTHGVKFDPECKSMITKVSKFLAFDLMPNLKVFAHLYQFEG